MPTKPTMFLSSSKSRGNDQCHAGPLVQNYHKCTGNVLAVVVLGLFLIDPRRDLLLPLSLLAVAVLLEVAAWRIGRPTQ
jgi:hypothetical protein